MQIPPILQTVVLQLGHFPFAILTPFAVFDSVGSFISTFALHLTQYPCVAIFPPLSLINLHICCPFKALCQTCPKKRIMKRTPLCSPKNLGSQRSEKPKGESESKTMKRTPGIEPGQIRAAAEPSNHCGTCALSMQKSLEESLHG